MTETVGWIILGVVVVLALVMWIEDVWTVLIVRRHRARQKGGDRRE